MKCQQAQPLHMRNVGSKAKMCIAENLKHIKYYF